MKILEPNMYVRTKKAIGKVYQICKNEKNEDGTIYNKFILNTNDRLEICDTDLVVKASHNIIDLIEAGDIIEVQEFKGKYEVKQYGLELSIVKDEHIYNLNSLHCKLNIKSIVTKQQMESMQYEVK